MKQRDDTIHFVSSVSKWLKESGAAPGLSQDPRITPMSPAWVTGTQELQPSSTAPPGFLAGS